MNKSTQVIRTLAVEMISKVNSGHPGIALGAAPILKVLYTKILNVDPLNPKWLNRDRFIMSAGHGSSLLYVLLHLKGFNVTRDDLLSFRTLGSKTPGHPEILDTEGVEMTTGPLGEGASSSVGMAISEARLNALFPEIINHYTYVFLGEGDLQEGVCMEAASLAGHLKLNKLIWILDSNKVQLDGPLSDANTENTKLKFEAMNWKVLEILNGDDEEEIYNCLLKAKNSSLPVLVIANTVIGKGAKNAGTNKVHGSPLTKEEVAAFRKEIGGEAFSIPRFVYDEFKTQNEKAHSLYCTWEKLKKPESFKLLLNPVDSKMLDTLPVVDEKFATRNLGGEIINFLQEKNPKFIGGSADLSSSTKVKGLDGAFNFDNRLGRDIKFGVREHAMAAIANGIMLYGVFSPFVSGFFVFSDFLKPALRLSSLMKLPVLYVFTHDSIGVGEDGPTHQPIEQLSMFRSQPNTIVLRPGSFYEVREAFKIYLNTKDAPVIIALTRQNIDNLALFSSDIQRGGYVVKEFDNEDGILIASGSELDLALKVSEELKKKHHLSVRVVSMMSVELFNKQSAAYREKVLPKKLTKRMIIEMSDGIHLMQFKENSSHFCSQVMTSFGSSGEFSQLCEKFGFTVANIVKKYLEIK